ncbi:MAG: putative phage tail protein [Faecousia sp.]
MRYRTELMKSILTSQSAQRIIDWVSPIYGNSYVGLWLFEAIGVVMDDVYDIAIQLLFETSPCTADLLLDYWERQYGIQTDISLTKEQRRARIIDKKLNRGPCNPARLEAAVSTALGGAQVEITENVSQNTFLVNIREVVPSIVPAVAVVERMKPAHLVYKIQVATQTVSDADIKVAVAMTHAEQYNVEVFQ